MTSKPITVNGITFPSLRQAAAHFGKHYGNAARRVKQGWALEEALELVPHQIKRPERGIKLTTSAGTFDSIRDAAEHFGIEEGTIHKRLSMGWTPDQAVGLEPHSRKPKRTKEIACAGKVYPNSWAMAQAYGKKEKLVAKRLRLGWTPEQAVEIEVAPPRFRSESYTSSGKHWRKVEEINGELHPATDQGEYKLYLITNKVNGKQYVGITINPLWQRFNGHKAAVKKSIHTKLYNAMRLHGVENFSIELIRSDARSFTELQQQEIDEINKRNTIENGYNVSPGGSIGTPERVTVGGLVFPSRGAAAEYFGIDVGVFNLRLSKLKWTPEQAAEIEPRPKAYREKVTVNGREYPSLFQAVKEHGLNYQLVWDRFKSKGWTLEQALGLAPPPDTTKYLGIKLVAFGQMFSSLKACAEFFGVTPDLLSKKIRSGQSIEQAIEITLANKKRLGRD